VQPVSTAVSSPNLAAAAPSEAAVMAQASSENFPVATHLLGRRQRAHLLAIYGFARLVDDLGDEAPGDRTGLLDWLERDLDRVYHGDRAEHLVMRRLQGAVGACALPDGPFRRLIVANRRDQVVSRYETFDELLGYCQLSAAPVGELVLHVFGAATRDRIALSDRICAALQVVEHLQDVAEDYTRERVYLPREDMRRFGCEERHLAAGTAGPALRALIAFESGRARSLLAEGLPLLSGLAARPRIAVAGFIAGGRAALDALEREGYDVLGTRARPTRRLLAVRWLNATVGR
jgi:squalene synthase HpnC